MFIMPLTYVQSFETDELKTVGGVNYTNSIHTVQTAANSIHIVQTAG